MKVSWDDEIPNIWNNIKCSKPPTSYKHMGKATKIKTALGLKNVDIYKNKELWKQPWKTPRLET
jgi:hypothetical protein